MTERNVAISEIRAVWRDFLLLIGLWTVFCLALGWHAFDGRPYLIRDLSFLTDPESIILMALILGPAGAFLHEGYRAVRILRDPGAQGEND